MKKIALIGASGHGKVVADIAKQNGYSEIVFLDDNENLSQCGGYPVIGTSKLIPELDCDFFVSIGNARIRQMIQDKLKTLKKNVPSLIHPYAVIAEDVKIGDGTVVMAGAVVNPGAVIGNGCIINTGSSVDHDCRIGDYVHISVGAHIAGTVVIHDRTWVGAGATVSNNLEICSDCMIGAGAVVVKDVKEQGVYIGVPSMKIKEINIQGGKSFQ